MRIPRILINITLPVFLIMLFASILTTNQYLQLSKGLYESHDEIEFDFNFASDRIMGYLNYRYDDLDVEYNEGGESYRMRDTEIRHMVDVKNLYTTLRLVALGCLIVAISMSYLLYRKDKYNLYKAYKTLPIGPLFFIMFVGGYVIIDFQTAFTTFHKIFFSNNDWLLRSDDILILMLPTNFWMVSGISILVLFSISLAVIYYLNEKVYKQKVL